MHIVYIIIFILLSGYSIWAYIWLPHFHWRAVVHKGIQNKLKSTRCIEPELDVIEKLSRSTATPLEYSQQYMSHLCQSYGVPVGCIYPEDRFDLDLSVEIKSLPHRIQDIVKNKTGDKKQMFCDGDQMYDYVTWEWWADRDVIMPREELVAIANESGLTVAMLCEKLYIAERRIAGPSKL